MAGSVGRIGFSRGSKTRAVTTSPLESGPRRCYIRPMAAHRRMILRISGPVLG
jgi:hypothetical protein